MNHPIVMYELAKLRIAEDLRAAEHERLIREAGRTRPGRSIDAVPFRERLARLVGSAQPKARGGAAAGA
jgi:hypothetical protein